MTDPVNHPPHYCGHASGVECIEVTRWLSFNRGNAFKYIFRHRDKGAPKQDLNKALWYMRDEIRSKRHDTKRFIENIGELRAFAINACIVPWTW